MPAVHPFPEQLSIYRLKLLLYQSYFFLSATAQLNSELEFDSHSAGGIEITLNKNVAMIMIYKSGNLTGGNTDQILCNIPDNGRFVRAIFAPCEVLSYNWTPIGNTGYVTFEDNTIKIRCKDSINDGVVVANLMIPRHIIQFD